MRETPMRDERTKNASRRSKAYLCIEEYGLIGSPLQIADLNPVFTISTLANIIVTGQSMPGDRSSSCVS